MTRSSRAIVAVFFGGAVVLANGIAPRPSDARGTASLEEDAPKPKPEDSAHKEEEQTLRDELDEVRVREEVLKWERDADRNHLQQQVQMSRQIRSLGGIGFGMGGGEGGKGLTEEQRKQAKEQQEKRQRVAVAMAERGLREAESEYLKTTKALARVSRERAELERRVGEEPPVKPKSDGAVDHIQRVGEIVRQVQGEAAKFLQDGRPEGGPAPRKLGAGPRGTRFLRVGDHIVNPKHITHVSIFKEGARVFFTGSGEPLPMDSKTFEELESRLEVRGR